jgi:D-glycero-D-manno-heptose 1,7-bisphosphate phosphatase
LFIMARPAVFLDKDGTLIVNVPYNADPALLQFQPGACDALAAFAKAGYALVMISNQSGIALGRFSHAQFGVLRRVLAERLVCEAGVVLTDFVYCPHAPKPSGEPDCLCRKPSPLMLRYAALKHGLDLARSWMVGDTLDDVEAGRRAGCRTVLYDSGGETSWRSGALRKPHACHRDWSAVQRTILAKHSVDA